MLKKYYETYVYLPGKPHFDNMAPADQEAIAKTIGFAFYRFQVAAVGLGQAMYRHFSKPKNRKR